MNPLLMFVSCILFLSLPLFGFYLARRFKQQMPDDVSIGYGRAYWFCLSMMLYACLLTGVAELVYFKFLDHGAVFDSFYGLMNDPATKATYQQMGMKESWNTLMFSKPSNSILKNHFDNFLHPFTNHQLVGATSGVFTLVLSSLN